MASDRLTDEVKQHLIETGVGTDPALGPEEKETTITAPNDIGRCTIFTDIPTVIKWVLSIEESEITDHRLYSDGEVQQVVAVKATIPKGIIKLQKSARKSNTHSNMVSYGPHEV